MKDIWQVLEERTRAWSAIRRQTVADTLWEDYVTIRFGRSGDPRALEFLYPYLNHHDTATRYRAIRTACQVFDGRGPRALPYLEYFLNNSDHFLSDRAVQVVGAAMRGVDGESVIGALTPYLNHRNRFIRKQALVAVGQACEGQASEHVRDEIMRVGVKGGPSPEAVNMALAQLYSGKPTEEIYQRVVRPELVNRIDTCDEMAMAALVRNASEEWYVRAFTDAFYPRLHMTAEKAHMFWMTQFIRRDGVTAIIQASPGKGIHALETMLHLAADRCPGHAIYCHAPSLFVGADIDANLNSLMTLLKTGNVPVQRIAAVCLGRLMLDTQDEKTINLLRELCGAKNKAVQSTALEGLGMVARSSGDAELRKICSQRMTDPETAVAASKTMGMLFLGSGDEGVFGELQARIKALLDCPVKSRQYSKPLAACYEAVGFLFLGTGSTEPVQLLLDALAKPQVGVWDPYHWAASHSLVMTEFAESALGLSFLGIAT